MRDHLLERGSAHLLERQRDRLFVLQLLAPVRSVPLWVDLLWVDLFSHLVGVVGVVARVSLIAREE